MAVSAVLAALSFPAFWSNGYGLTQIGDVQLPLGSIVAGLNGLGWFGFMALYVSATRGLAARSLPVRLWDWGLGLMAVSTFGVLGLAGTVALNTAHPTLQQLFLHLFLDLFGVGWFTLGLLGALWAALLPEGGWPSGMPVGSLALALLPTFMLGMAPMTVTPLMLWTAAAANLIAAILLARHLAALWRRRRTLPWLIRFAGLALTVHVVIAVMLMWPGVWRWGAGTQLRIFWLHNFLLGWVSSGLLGLLLWLGYPSREGLGWLIQRAAVGVWIVGVGG